PAVVLADLFGGGVHGQVRDEAVSGPLGFEVRRDTGVQQRKSAVRLVRRTGSGKPSLDRWRDLGDLFWGSACGACPACSSSKPKSGVSRPAGRTMSVAGQENGQHWS